MDKSKNAKNDRRSNDLRCVEFKPTRQKRGLFVKNEVPVLAIFDGVIHYSFKKYHTRSKADVMNLILCKDFTSLYTPSKEDATLTMDVNNVEAIRYDNAQNLIWIVGKFKVAYVNPRTGDAMVKEYEDGSYCIEFPFQFENVEAFIELVDKYKSKNKSSGVPTPVSL